MIETLCLYIGYRLRIVKLRRVLGLLKLIVSELIAKSLFLYKKVLYDEVHWKENITKNV